MYYVPDGTKECGYYECKKCGSRFLSLQTMNTIPCPDCGMDIDYEIGPDETLEAAENTAVLVEKITGEEEVEKMQTILVSWGFRGRKALLEDGAECIVDSAEEIRKIVKKQEEK